MPSHQEARQVVAQAVAQVLGKAPTLAQVQAVQAVCYLETKYGTAVPPAGVGSNNWGNYHWVEGSKNGRATGYYDGADATSDGKGYAQKFRTYATPVDGVADVAGHLNGSGALAAAIDPGTVWAVATAMRKGRYYGDQRTPDEPQIERYGGALESIVREIDRVCADAGKGLSLARPASAGNALLWLALAGGASWMLVQSTKGGGRW